MRPKEFGERVRRLADEAAGNVDFSGQLYDMRLAVVHSDAPTPWAARVLFTDTTRWEAGSEEVRLRENDIHTIAETDTTCYHLPEGTLLEQTEVITVPDATRAVRTALEQREHLTSDEWREDGDCPYPHRYNFNLQVSPEGASLAGLAVTHFPLEETPSA